MVLQQVGGARSARVDERERVIGIDVLGEDDHADIRVLALDRGCGGDAFAGVAGRHADIDQCHVRARPGHGTDQGVGVAYGRGDLMAAGAQQLRKPVADQRGVVGDNEAHGISARMIVPAPLPVCTERVPSSAPTRSRRP